MSDSQVWSDVVAMALALRSDEDANNIYGKILQKYAWMDVDGRLVVDIGLVTVMMTLLSALVDSAAEHLGMEPDDLGNFLLMEKFKRDLFDD